MTFDPGEADDLNFAPRFRDRFVAVLPAGHALLSRKNLKWRELKKHPYLALQRPSSIRRLIDTALLKHNISLLPAFEAHQPASIGRMVTAGLGVSVVPALSISQMEEMGAECRPLSGPVITRELGVITRKRQPLSAAAQAMLEVIARWADPASPTHLTSP